MDGSGTGGRMPELAHDMTFAYVPREHESPDQGSSLETTSNVSIKIP